MLAFTKFAGGLVADFYLERQALQASLMKQSKADRRARG
jgi:hypothetical protein